MKLSFGGMRFLLGVNQVHGMRINFFPANFFVDRSHLAEILALKIPKLKNQHKTIAESMEYPGTGCFEGPGLI